MVEKIVLKNRTGSGETLEATFLPEKGMNMVSFKKGDLEVIDQSTKKEFEERFGGLGPLIGPHFYRRKQEIIPKIADESLFPHISHAESHGSTDPFSHGVGRYAPWKVEATPTKVSGVLTGKDTWNGVALASLEGQNFKMNFTAEMLETGLQIDLSVVSDTDSLVGIHYYYHLPNGKGVVTSQVQKTIIDSGERKSIPQTWPINDQHLLTFDLNQDADFTFFPYPNLREGHIILETDGYKLSTKYFSSSQENSWQLYHPKGASFVCIEPLSSQDPHHPNLTVSSIKILLSII